MSELRLITTREESYSFTKTRWTSTLMYRKSFFSWITCNSKIKHFQETENSKFSWSLKLKNYSRLWWSVLERKFPSALKCLSTLTLPNSSFELSNSILIYLIFIICISFLFDFYCILL